MSFYTNVTKNGNYIEFRGYDDNGRRLVKKTVFQPTLYFHGEDKKKVTPFVNLKGEYLTPTKYYDMAAGQQDLNMYGSANGGFVYGSSKFVTQYIQENYPNDINFDLSKIRIGTLDIEVVSENEFPEPEKAIYPIVSICVHSTKTDEYYVIGTHESQKYSKEKTELSIPKEKLVYLHAKNEDELLAMFIKLWQALDLDVVTGWYIKGFDIPYIINRIKRLAGDVYKLLSPWKRIYDKVVFENNKNLTTYEIVGITTLDYIDVFKKFGYVYGPQESYRLDAIAYSVLGERKLDYKEYGNLSNLYKQNYQIYIDYNIRDVNLVVRIERKAKLLQLAFTVAYMSGSSFSETLGTVGVWTSFIYRHMIRKGIVPSANRIDNQKADFEGGYVKEPIPKVYDWVCSFDLDSLYPNLIVQYNMSPETIVGKLDDVSVEKYFNGEFNASEIEGDYAVAANGAYFRRDKQGLIPEIVESLYAYRVNLKKQMKEETNEEKRLLLDNNQHAIKILLNSLYGAMSNIYFQYFDIRIAEAITLNGQLCIKWAARVVNDFLNKGFKTDKDYIIAIDTDSIYVDLSSIIKDTDKDPVTKLDEFCKNYLKKVIDKGYDELAGLTNAYKNRMSMKRETIADRGLWTAKKRYILNVWDKEGKRYKEPELKIMGVEAVRSTTPEVIRNKLKETFKVLLMETPKTSHDFMDSFKKEFFKLKPEEVSFPKGVNNIEKYSSDNTVYKKGTPMQVRASILYNKLLKDKNVKDKYRPINSGDKIKYSYLRTPNPINENVIAFPDVLPEEFGLHEYVDYDTQFAKGYTEPLRPIFNALGWSVDDYVTAEDFLE